MSTNRKRSLRLLIWQRVEIPAQPDFFERERNEFSKSKGERSNGSQLFGGWTKKGKTACDYIMQGNGFGESSKMCAEH